MVTFLDIGLLQHVSIIFPFLLVFAIVYGLLMFIKPFGDDKGINSIIAVCVAALLMFSSGAVQLISYIAPWFAIVFIFLFFMIVAYRMLGAPESAIANVMKEWGTLHWFLLAIGLIIMLGAISEVYGPTISPEGDVIDPETGEVIETPESGGYQTAVKEILFHPRVLGLGLLLLIITFAIRVLTEKTK